MGEAAEVRYAHVEMPVIVAEIPDDIDGELVERLCELVAAAAAEVGVQAPPVETTDRNAYFRHLTARDRALFEKAKAITFDRFGIFYEWRNREVAVVADPTQESA